MTTKRLLLLLILAVALVARFRYITAIEHNVDHAYPVWQAMRTLDAGLFPLAGQGTSVLFANPALTGYLFIPAVALTRSPLGVYVFVIALNTLAVWMAYRAAASLTGHKLALVAAGLMAVNPWVIEYSRTSWVQSLLPFFVCAVAWLLWPVLLGQSQRPIRRTALALTMTALLTQTYLLAYFILAPVIVLLFIYRRNIPRRGLLLGGAAIAITSALYGAGLLNQWEAVQDRLANFTGGESRLTSEAWDSAVRLVTGAEYELARGALAPADDAILRHDLSRIAHGAVLVMLVVGVGYAVIYTRGHTWVPPYISSYIRRGRPVCRPENENRLPNPALIPLVWFFLPVLAMSYTSNPVHPFYLLLTLPAGYVLAAWGIGIVAKGIAAIMPRLHENMVLAGVGLVLAFGFAPLMLTNSARYYQETHAIPGAHGFTALPVDVGLGMGAAVRDALPTGGTVYAPADGWIHNSFAGELFPVIPDVRVPRFNYVPRNGGVYVQMAAEGESAPLPAFATRMDTIPLADGTTITVDTLPPAAQVEVPGTRLDVPSQQGITLMGYELSNGDADWTLTTYWRVDAVAPEVRELIFSPFVHVFNADGDMLHNISGEGLPGTAWHEGDLHVHTVIFSVPEGVAFEILVGQFDGLHNVNVIFLPPDDDPGVVVALPQR